MLIIELFKREISALWNWGEERVDLRLSGSHLKNSLPEAQPAITRPSHDGSYAHLDVVTPAAGYS